jgi:hypothetical protein
MANPENKILVHFGVKGMKWGVHRNRPSLPASQDSQRATEVRTKVKTGGTKALSNKELQDLITRMNLEQQFSRLNPSKLEKGTQIASRILGVGNTINQAIAFVNSPAGKAVKDAVLKKRG